MYAPHFGNTVVEGALESTVAHAGATKGVESYPWNLGVVPGGFSGKVGGESWWEEWLVKGERIRLSMYEGWVLGV